MNNLNFTGRLGGDMEIRYTGDGKPVGNFSVAMDAGYGDKKQTVWLDCSLWRNPDKLEQYLKKGTQVAANGELSLFVTDKGKTYLKLRIAELTLIGGRTSEDNAKPAAQEGFREKPQQKAPDALDDDIPF